jgi:hypothetical protein
MKDVHIPDELEEYVPSGNARLIQGQRDSNNRRKNTDGNRATFTKNEKQAEAIQIMSSPTIRFFLIDGGSRSGKTFIMIYAIFVRALKYENSRHCILRLRYNHAKTSLCRDTIPKVIRICFPNLVDKIEENKSESFYTLPNGAEVWIGGLDDKARVEKILGNEYGTLYFNECSQIDYAAHEIALTRLAQKCVDPTHGEMKLMALYDCNPPSIKHWTYLQWYEHTHPETNIEYTEEQRKQYAVLKINPTDNLENVGAAYLDILKNMSPEKQKRFLEGSYSTGAEGALFTLMDIHKNRILAKDCPDFTYCAVGVDPAAKGKTTSDETGIVGGGAHLIDGEYHYYIVLDNSIRGKPAKWANATVRMYEELQADKVVGETNNGGDMVEGTIRTVDDDISYIGVHASRGKAIRAEPVASLAYRGRLHIVGHLPDLEDEMVSWEPDESTWSPNRLDAMVWMITWLMSKTKVRKPRIRKLGV